MKRNNLIMLSLLVAFAIIGCERFQLPERDASESKAGDDESHYSGKNCMDCHYSEGRGEGWFSVAGTVMGAKPGDKLELYADALAQSKVASIEFDDLDNAFTTKSIYFGNGLYAGIRDENGKLKLMDKKIYVGQCNLCHAPGAQQETLKMK